MVMLPLARVLNRNVPMTANRDFIDVPLMGRPQIPQLFSIPVFLEIQPTRDYINNQLAFTVNIHIGGGEILKGYP